MFDVEQAMRLVEESQGSLLVYRDNILPTVRHSVDAARASYVAGRLDFLRLVASQRQLLEMQDRYYEVMADYRKRDAALRRLIGEPPAAPVGRVPEAPAGPVGEEEPLPDDGEEYVPAGAMEEAP